MNVPFLTEGWLFSIRRKLIRFFALEDFQDPENATDETIFRVVKAISKGTTISVKPETFAYAVAKLVAKEIKRQERKRNEIQLDETTPDPPRSDDSYADGLHGCLEKCLRELSPFERSLIIKYHEGTASGENMRNRRVLAELLKMPVTKLRKEAMTIRQKLEGCITDCIEP